MFITKVSTNVYEYKSTNTLEYKVHSSLRYREIILITTTERGCINLYSTHTSVLIVTVYTHVW